MKKRRTKSKTTNTILLIIGILTIIFTAICLWLFYLYQTVPDVLITAWFGAVFGELSVCGWIKTVKTKHLKGEENEDRLD